MKGTDADGERGEVRDVTKRERAVILGKAAAFLLVGVFLFALCEQIFMEKSSYRKYRAWKRAENVDVLILGNSHADNGLRAQTMSAALSEAAGEEVRVFNYAIFGMRMEQMYFFAKEVFKTHVPDTVIVETYAFCPLADEHRDILARRAFDVFPLSANKVEAINYCVLEDRASYLIPFISYHTRWKELSKEDVALLYDRTLWPEYGSEGVGSEEQCPDPGDGWFDQAPPWEERALTPSEEECLERFLDLLEEHGTRLVFVSLPFKQQMGLDSMEAIKINNYLQAHYVNGDTVRLLDMNRLWKELDFTYGDLLDEGHVNRGGADKVTACLLDYLKSEPGLTASVGEGR